MATGIPDVPYYVFDIDGTLTRYVDVDPAAFLHGNFLFPIVRDLMVERGADPDEAAAAILRETSTFGVRRSDCARYELDREIVPGDVRVKVGHGYGVEKSKPEFADRTKH